jgi:LemA protein|nr:LemA family protein [Kofleriaceae bacterium]
MARTRWSVVVTVALAAVIALASCHKYNELVEDNAICDEKWANIDAELQRRYDLIPNIVSTIKAQAKFEEDTLTQVTQARASAVQIKMTGDDFSDPAKMAAFQNAQEQLKGSLSRLMMVQEKYPDLATNASFHDLNVTLESTENRMLRAREEYNAAVRTYNAELGKVGGKVVNDVTGTPFKPRIYWAADAAAHDAPKVNF